MGKKKFGKKPKDKNAPKRPTTAFFIFANEIRAEVKENNPGASIGQIGKILGVRWAALAEERKASYKAQNQKEKEIYREVLEDTKRLKNLLNTKKKLVLGKQLKKQP